MDDLTEADVAPFLLELTALTKKHGIEIWGCGCCGSPSLSRLSALDYDKRYHYDSQLMLAD